MHPETEFLRTIAEDIAGRQSPESINEPQADHRLLLEARRLEKAITLALRSIDNFTQRDTFHNDTIAKLVDICNLLYDPNLKVTPDVKVLLELITAVKQVLPREVSPLLRLPKAFVFTQKETFRNEWDNYHKAMNEYGIDKKLILIAAVPFQRFIDGKEKLYWGDFTWLKGYAAKLDAIDWDNADCNSKTEALMSLLIGRDFNHDRFFVYCKKYIQERVSAINNKKRRLQEYEICRKLVVEDTQTDLPSFDRHANSVSVRMLKWIKEEIDALKSYEGIDDELYKVEFNLDVESIALYYKYLMDKGITKKVTLDLYARQIAATVSSHGKEEFQWDTLYKRLYSKEQKTLKRLFEPLNAIVEDIRHFLRK